MSKSSWIIVDGTLSRYHARVPILIRETLTSLMIHKIIADIFYIS